MALCFLRLPFSFALYSQPSSVQEYQVTPMPCTLDLYCLMCLSCFELYEQLCSGHSCHVTTNIVHVGSVHLNVTRLLRLVLATELRAVMSLNANAVNHGLVLLQSA